MEKIRYERELYEPLKDYLTGIGYDVRAEINKCDLAARRENQLIVVEMKRHLSIDLLAQAIERQSYADAVYVCIPKPAVFKADKEWRAKLKVLRQLGLGLLLVGRIGSSHTVEEALSPCEPAALRKSSRKRHSLEKEFENRTMDLNTGGTRAVPLVTAYRESALFVAFLINRNGPLTSKELRTLGSQPKKTTAILNANYYGWFEKCGDKRYALTCEGEKALTAYAPLVGAFGEQTACVSAEQSAGAEEAETSGLR